MNDRLHPEATADTPVDQAAIDLKKAEKIAYENNKLHKRLCRQVGQAIGDYNMIEDGDKVMVCLSGGKDSYALLDILLTLRERAPIHFDIVAVNLDQKQPNFPADILPAYLDKLGVPYHIENQDTYSIVKRVVPEGKTTCALCSRLRRGILYRVAGELGATKVALGHHRDDILETFFLNMFFGAKLKGMPPKLQSDDGKRIVIRPLAYVKEADLIRYADVKQFPIIPCDLCGSQENLQRKQIKGLMREWEKKFPGRVDNIFSALSTVVPSHLMDRELFGFADLKASGEADANGDIAFDEEPCSTGTPAAGGEFNAQVISLFPAD
ncbi:tRNA 2-thiocytidine(32) synthetase TtcA [Herbaspirillum robiniae]|uniref:tRNA-cytidine(32) 2-sulfurtransferase n=1 Tax=Herbaspirillum robiniae TaxID=2014887 RepID=A0A246WP02_9BURK|nr:tRNA 2-thiocytidine(32) synthetase TtcA [Herbaspirillum robiniae]NUU03871.1 tRNA 2-thiocytidine(32) synthetase TtcA [Herbaspirillum robiniae]OWY28096.1 tRNA 2-thiocytidine(32) synthetase TtcA [Herbaspirillum robiniae]